jgi:dissimilatory sulfite reductase (desulfoviridin) alpha/beta subunit
MRWTREAEEEITKVPFFVRRRVRRRVEEEAERHGKKEVHISHVRTCQKKFLEKMDDEISGFRIETCFGSAGCPNRALESDGLAKRVEEILAAGKLREMLVERVEGELKFHHELVVSVSDCPNGCSRPQIADIGIVGASKPSASSEVPCTQCGACIEICQENALSLENEVPLVNEERCVFCGQCVRVCPTGTLREESRGYRIMGGGRLGRHPRFGTELSGIFSEEEAVQVVQGCVDFYRNHAQGGERLGKILERTGLEALVRELPVIQKKMEKNEIS